VRGTLRVDGGCYDLKDASRVSQHFTIPESQDTVVVLRQPSVADAIRFALRVLSTIDLDDQSRLSAYKIDNVGTDRLLPNELKPFDRSRP
jgi:hypothetical protein